MANTRMMFQKLGFQKKSEFKWFISLATPMLLFILFRFPIVSVRGFLCNPMNENAGPGECYWHTIPWSRTEIGIYMHLWSVFPGTLLAILQFIPAIRVRRPQVHRTLGYVCWALGISSAISALMICEHSFGGTKTTIFTTILLASACFVGHYKAYRAIKAYKIDKHREWMLRTWMYIGSILTMRPIFPLVALFVTFLNKNGLDMIMELPCPQVFHMLNNGQNTGKHNQKPDFFSTHGFTCSPDQIGMMSPYTVLNTSKMTPSIGYEHILMERTVKVSADVLSKRAEFQAAALDIAFGPAFLIGLIINIIVVEWYLRNTKDEALRLQKLGVIKKKAAERKLLEKLEKKVPAMDESKTSIRLPEAEALRGNIVQLK